MTAVVYDDVGEYAARVRPVLRGDEAVNSLALGVLWQLEHRDLYGERRLGAVEEGGDVLGVFLRTPPWPWIVVVAEDADEDEVVAAVVDHLVNTDAAPAPVHARVPLVELVAQRWAGATGGVGEPEMAMRVMACDRVELPRRPDGARRPAGPDDLPVVRDWMSDFQLEVFGEPLREPEVLEERLGRSLSEAGHGLWLWQAGGEVVSLAEMGRPTGRGERIGPVYTPRPVRGRGYAGRLVAEITAEGLERGLSEVFLFTDAANPVSNAVYERIGYRQVGEAANWRVTAP